MVPELSASGVKAQVSNSLQGGLKNTVNFAILANIKYLESDLEN